MRRLFRPALGALGALALFELLQVGSACSTFGEDDPTGTPPDASPSSDDVVSPPATEAGADAAEAGPEELPAIRAFCPPPRAPSRALSESTTRILYEPDTLPRFPFAITTDAKFVYWVEQDTSGDGYNGHSNARILRIPRAGGDAVEIATNQPGVTALALDGEYVYWATTSGGETRDVADISRAHRVCASGACAPEPVLHLERGRVTELFRTEPGVIYALTTSALVRFSTSGSPPAREAPLGAAPSGFAFAASTPFVSSSTGPSITAFAADLATWTSFSPASTTDPITSLTTDCTNLWATTNSAMLGVQASTRSLTASPQAALADTFDSATDEQYVYVARANAGGVDAFSKKAGTVQNVWSGNAFAVHVDDDGVYWGDHAPKTGGRLYVLEK